MGEDVERHPGVGQPVQIRKAMTMMITMRVTSFGLLSGGRLPAAGQPPAGTQGPVSRLEAPLGRAALSLINALVPGPTAPVPQGPYLLGREHQLPVAEEYARSGDGEVDHEHVDDERLIVDLLAWDV